MPVSRTQRTILTGAAALGFAAGAAGIAAAATSAATSNPTPAVAAGQPDPGSGDHEVNDTNPTYTSSVTAPDTEAETGLDALATVSADQAIAAAQSATGGTSSHAELENENGSVVYGVVVSMPDGTKLDVKVDAGNATVLSQQADDDKGSEHEVPGAESQDTGGDQSGSESN